jgi:hypothetical protein
MGNRSSGGRVKWSERKSKPAARPSHLQAKAFFVVSISIMGHLPQEGHKLIRKSHLFHTVGCSRKYISKLPNFFGLAVLIGSLHLSTVLELLLHVQEDSLELCFYCDDSCWLDFICSNETTDNQIEDTAKRHGHDGASQDYDIVRHTEVGSGERKEHGSSAQVHGGCLFSVGRVDQQLDY